MSTLVEILDTSIIPLEDILARRAAEAPDVSAAVAPILADVKALGDAALLRYTEQFDGVRPASLRVSPEEIATARAGIGEEFLQVLQNAAANIRSFHQKQVRQGFVATDKPGVVMGQKIMPLACVGIYVPAGSAPLPSTALMNAIPAAIAGVKRVVMFTPPRPDGTADPAILAAADIAGVTEIYKAGGAQAIAAMAYGTQTVPRVDKIVGPGNIYVATAKKMVYGQVDIDMIAGPSDILVVADETANAAAVAADLLGQAEHDPMAAAVLVSTSRPLCEAVQKELARQLPLLPRRQIAEASLKANGRILLAESLPQAMEIANAIAPEHLELCVEQPFELLPAVQNAGSIFLGHNTPEALGDYFAGPNHTLPTGGTARFYSPLSVDDFIKKSSYLYYSKTALLQAADDVISFARREGLDAHAESVAVRLFT